MQGEYPALPIHWIPKQKRHQRAFGVKHFLEKKFLTGIRITDGKVWLDGIEIREQFILENADLAPGPINIDVTGIKAGLFQGTIPFEMTRCTNSQDWHDYIMRSCGCEESHIARLEPKDLERPAIMLAWVPNLAMTSTVDGSHRICRRWRDGLTFFEVAMVHYKDVKQFVKMEGRGDGKGRFA